MLDLFIFLSFGIVMLLNVLLKQEREIEREEKRVAAREEKKATCNISSGNKVYNH